MTEIDKRNMATLENLASEINAEHRAFVGSLKKTAEHGIRAGELLSEAKSKCKHGEWLPWLQTNFEGAPRTAQDYMRLYNHRDEIRAKTRDSAHLGISGALKEIAAPKDNRHLGSEWEKAYRAWTHALGTPEEPQWLASLKELDRQARPSDLPPSRLHGSFAEELTGEEMQRTFDELIRTGAIASWEAVRDGHVWRRQVAGNILREAPDTEDRNKFIQDVINAGSVRPAPIDAITAQLEYEGAE
jgi:hypothetical protein